MSGQQCLLECTSVYHADRLGHNAYRVFSFLVVINRSHTFCLLVMLVHHIQQLHLLRVTLLVLLCFEATLSHAQGLYLALHSGVTPGGLQNYTGCQRSNLSQLHTRHTSNLLYSLPSLNTFLWCSHIHPPTQKLQHQGPQIRLPSSAARLKESQQALTWCIWDTRKI